jgi:hypothetical protein
MERQSEDMTQQIGEEVAASLEMLKGTLEGQPVNHQQPINLKPSGQLRSISSSISKEVQ